MRSHVEDIRVLIRAWEHAIQAGDTAGILAHHSEDVLMFDVPEPLQSVGIDAYRRTWELFYRYGQPSQDVFVIEDLRITAGNEVAFATGLLRIGGSEQPVCRLTLGLRKRNGEWWIVHEHHSAPYTLTSLGPHMKPITVCLGFDKDLEAAVATYVSLFDTVFGNSKILGRSYFGAQEIAALRQLPEMSEEIMPGSAGDVKTIRFALNGQEILAFKGGGYFGKFHESMSLYVSCTTQEQIDQLWAVLSNGGEEQPCGWVKDRFGVSWQIVPHFVWEVDEGPDRKKAERMNIALFGMKKIDLVALRAAMEAR